MIAVIASLILLFYVLIPSAIFRLVASIKIPIKRFHKTKAQDFTFSVSICLIPAGLAILLVWYVVHSPFSTSGESLAQRRLAYRTFFASMYSDKELEQSLRPTPTSSDPSPHPIFWSSVNSVLKRQGRFLFWFYLLIVAEAGFIALLAKQYRTGKRRWRDRLGGSILPAIISEWYVILDAFGSPPADREINVDVLSADGILYQGKLKDYFLNVEGDLSGILVSHALRFAREEFEDHRRTDLQVAVAAASAGAAPIAGETPVTGPPIQFMQDRSKYWRPIEGSDVFFIPRERISNINVRHVPINVQQATAERFAERKIDIKDLKIQKLNNKKEEQK